MGVDTLLYRDGDKDYIEMETKGARPGLGLWEGGKVDKDVRVGKDVKVGGGSGEWAN